MRAPGATHHFVSTVDDIAWLLNLRGADVSYNPVFLAHLLIDAHGATLFVGDGQDRRRARSARSTRDGVASRPTRRRAPRSRRCRPTATLLIDPTPRHARPAQSVADGARSIEAINPSTLLKSRKSDAEAAHVRARDGRGRRRDVRVLRLVRGGARRSERSERSPS